MTSRESVPNARVLVVEDEGIVAKDIQNMLKSLGYAVSAVAASGEEAIEKAAETHPDLVLMDIALIGAIDGVEAAEKKLMQMKDELIDSVSHELRTPLH